MNKAETFKQILDKVSEQFLKYGLRNLSMEGVAHELGISKKTLYGYVSNKAELIEAVMDNNRDNICRSMCDVQQMGFNAIDELIEISRVVYSYQSTSNPSMLSDLEKYYPDLFTRFLERKLRSVHTYVTENLNNGIREGLYRADLDVSLVASLYVKKMESVLDDKVFMNENVSFERIFEVMFENHIRGIANETGIAYFERIKNKYKILPSS